MTTRAVYLLPALSAALAFTGCSGKMFRPVTPHAAEDPNFAVRVEGIYVTHMPGSTLDEARGVSIGLEVDWRAPIRIGEARLTTAAVPPCSSGVKAKDIVSAGRYGPGPEEVALSFSRPDVEGARVFDDGSAVLDLTVFPADRSAPGRCLRIAVVEPGGPPDAAQWVHHAFLLGGEERVMFFFHSRVPKLETPGLILGVGMGAWYGRWNWMIEGEGGLAGRTDATDANGMRALFGLWGGSVAAGTLLFHHGKFGLGTLAGYEVLRGVPGDPIPADPMPEPMTLHGPRVGLRLLYLVDPLAWPHFRSPPDAFVGGLSFYAGNWWSGTDLGRASPFLGFAFEGNLGF